MSDKPAQDKTEAPSPHRREKAKDEGNVARSMDLNSVAVMLAGIIAIQFNAEKLFKSLSDFMISTFRDASIIDITPDSLPLQVLQAMKYLAPGIVPILLILLLAGIGINYAQVGVIFAKKALIPKFDRVSPLKGFKRLFSLRSLVELLKGLLKIGIVGIIGFSVLNRHLTDYWILSNTTAGQTITFIGQVFFEMSLKIGMALLALALLDFAYQKWEFEKNLKMTKEEVKEEQKQYEGNPELKARIRSLQKQAARRRMMAAVPDATVVVTNPTTIAIALKYAPMKKEDAPMVVAKGKRKIADKIKEIALLNDVPIIENKPLARSLFDTTEPGMEIPIIYYQAVAEILAQVYQLNQNRNSYV
ncbi:MAG: flagellar biosynthesis protein FlhB [Candidatus Hatepunaea meridiana]|nr:flagellar biosynthesis protein FlhB [Candidatus Hatepunaea meridiana]